MAGNGNIPYMCYFQLSCFAKQNSKQSDHGGRAAASYYKAIDTSISYICTNLKIYYA